MSFFTNLSVDWKNDFCITELTSLCQAMLSTTTNSVSLVTHADTHDQDQEEKMVKQIHQVRSSSGAWNDAQLNPAACVK